MGKFAQGDYTVINKEKYMGNIHKVRYLSSWELVLLKFFDMNTSILEWNSEDVIVPYYSNADQKKRRYMVDFYIKYKTKDGVIKKELLEVKPYAQTLPPTKRGRKKQSTFLKEVYTYQVNIDKWKAATAFAKARGMEFRLITEHDIFK